MVQGGIITLVLLILYVLYMSNLQRNLRLHRQILAYEAKTPEEVGMKVAEWRPSDPMQPEELGNCYYQGDILPRNGSLKPTKYWPNGVIIYEFDNNFDDRFIPLVEEAMEEFPKVSCIRWQKRTNESKFVKISSDKVGCNSFVGKDDDQKEGQSLNLQADACMRKHTIIHEMLHSVGFFHEHSKVDRDAYVTIHWENIKKGFERAFDIMIYGQETYFGEPYDYASMMHYSVYLFSKDPSTLPTITPKQDLPEGVELGKSNKFSKSDISRMNKLYKCKRNVSMQVR